MARTPKTSWSVQDARNHFSELVRSARREPQIVTRHGKPEVVVVDAARFRELARTEKARAPSFAEHLLAISRDDEPIERLDFEPRDVEL